MSSITFIYVCFLILLPITVQHQCVQFCFVSLKFDEKFDTLPSTCNRTYQNVECYTRIHFDYADELIEITFGEQSINNSSLIPDDYYVSQKTEMWHETYKIQLTISQHKCYHGDLCDFEYAKRKVFEMSKLTTNFTQFQQKLSAALITPDSGMDKNLEESAIRVEKLVLHTPIFLNLSFAHFLDELSNDEYRATKFELYFHFKVC